MGLAFTSLGRIFSPAGAAPVVREPNRRWARGGARPSLLRLTVVDVIVESPTTRTFVFGEDLPYRAGQHLTVVADIEGRTVRRCYSFSSSPVGSTSSSPSCSTSSSPSRSGSRPAITVKKVEGGVMSGWLHENVRSGDSLRAMPAAGEFTIQADPPRAGRAGGRHVAMIAGGVGITPIVSMTESLLREEPGARVTLLYGSRSRTELLFDERLQSLACEFEGRLDLHLAIEEADEAWNGLVGRLDADTVSRVATANEADDWFVCGPQPMMDVAVSTLAAAGVPSDRVHLERFQYAAPISVQIPTAPAALVFGRSGKAAVARAGSTILEAAEQAGIALPSSCRMGGCGACKVKVDGKVVAAEPNCLSEREKSEGWALSCCSYADGRVVLPDF